MNITPHFKSAEFERSQTAARAGISIQINAGTDVYREIKALCADILEPLRQRLGTPVIISSGYRPPRVNELVGGAPNSQHQYGQAADIGAIGLSDYDLAKHIYASGLPFDQLIYEFGRWVHVSHAPVDGSRPPRGEALTAYARRGGGVGYERGIVPLASIPDALR